MACEPQTPPAPGGAQNGYRFLERAQRLGVEVLGLEALFLFELDQGAEQSPLLLLRAPETSGLQGQPVSSEQDLIATLAGAPIYEKAGLTMMTVSSTNPVITKKGWTHVFRTIAHDGMQGPLMAQFAVQELGAKRLAIMYASHDYGKGLLDATLPEIPKLGAEAVAVETYVPGVDKDFSAQLTKIAQAKPEALLLLTDYAEGGMITKQRLAAGLGNVPVVASAGNQHEQFIQLGGEGAEGAYVMVYFDPEKPDPLTQEFVKKYLAKYGGKMPSEQAGYGYEAPYIYKQAIEMGATKETLHEFMNVLEAARLQGVERVVWASTQSVYGQADFYPPGPVNEDVFVRPTTLYGACKLFNEHVAEHYGKVYGLDTIGLRKSVVYGLGKSRRRDLSIAHLLIENPLLGKPMEMPPVDYPANFLYVKDVVRAYLLAVQAPRPKHRIFNIGGQVLRASEVVERMKRLVPGAEVRQREAYDLPHPIEVYHQDLSRAKEELGYEPVYTLEDGVRDYQRMLETLGDQYRSAWAEFGAKPLV